MQFIGISQLFSFVTDRFGISFKFLGESRIAYCYITYSNSLHMSVYPGAVIFTVVVYMY